MGNRVAGAGLEEEVVFVGRRSTTLVDGEGTTAECSGRQRSQPEQPSCTGQRDRDAELHDVVDLEASRHGTKPYLSPGFLWRGLSNAEVMSRPQKSKDIRTACDRIGGPWAMEFPGPLLPLS